MPIAVDGRTVCCAPPGSDPERRWRRDRSVVSEAWCAGVRAGVVCQTSRRLVHLDCGAGVVARSVRCVVASAASDAFDAVSLAGFEVGAGRSCLLAPICLLAPPQGRRTSPEWSNCGVSRGVSCQVEQRPMAEPVAW